MMKKLFPLLFLFGAALLPAEEAVKLPPPSRSGGMTLAAALNARRTFRVFQDTRLSRQQLSDLLWSANGVNRSDGKRTAPSARNRQETTLWLLTKDGAFLYVPATHSLLRQSSVDLRKAAGRFAAPAYLVLAADLDKCGRSARALDFARIDCGYVSQNIYLYCAGAGLGTCAIGSIPDPAALKKELGFGKRFLLLLTHCVGVPK